MDSLSNEENTTIQMFDVIKSQYNHDVKYSICWR